MLLVRRNALLVLDLRLQIFDVTWLHVQYDGLSSQHLQYPGGWWNLLHSHACHDKAWLRESGYRRPPQPCGPLMCSHVFGTQTNSPMLQQHWYSITKIRWRTFVSSLRTIRFSQHLQMFMIQFQDHTRPHRGNRWHRKTVHGDESSRSICRWLS